MHLIKRVKDYMNNKFTQDCIFFISLYVMDRVYDVMFATGFAFIKMAIDIAEKRNSWPKFQI